MSDFGRRFAEIFEGKKQREIAKILHVTDRAVGNYLGGRVPDVEKLQLVAEVTGCNLHWLLTGTGPKFGHVVEQNGRNSDSFDRLLEDRIREILRAELGSIGGEVGEIEPAERVAVRHYGTVDGGEEEQHEEVPRKRRTG